MPVVNPIDLQNSLFGVATFGEDVFLTDTTNTNDGIYYTKLFKKPSENFWNKVTWIDNQTSNTFDKVKIEVRIRTGNLLPIKNFTTGERYTLDELNSMIPDTKREFFDSIFYRETIGRSLVAPSGVAPNTIGNTIPSTPSGAHALGTNVNTSLLISEDDAIWNYWSLPIINQPSFIPENRSFDYLQARIALLSLDEVTVPKMFRISFSSIIKDAL